MKTEKIAFLAQPAEQFAGGWLAMAEEVLRWDDSAVVESAQAFYDHKDIILQLIKLGSCAFNLTLNLSAPGVVRNKVAQSQSALKKRLGRWERLRRQAELDRYDNEMKDQKTNRLN